MKSAAAALGTLLLLLPAAPLRAALPDEMAAARSAYNDGDWEDARRRFLELTGRYGDQGEGRDAWYYLALLSRPGDEYLSDLDQFLDHGGRRDPRGPYVELRAGRYYYSIGEYRTALTRFESARELRHDDVNATSEARYWVGLTLLALREPGEARRSLEEAALPKSPEAVRQAALFSLGELFRTSRDYGGAARAYAAYRDAFPDGDYAAASLFGEATARDLLGRKKEARDLYAELVSSYADHPEAAEARAWLKAAEGPPPPVTRKERSRDPAVSAELRSGGGIFGVSPGDTSIGRPGGGTPTPGAVVPPAGSPAGERPGAESGDGARGGPGGGDAAQPGSSPEAVPPGTKGAIGYSVQVGAFASDDNALKLADELLSRGYTRVRLEKGNEEPRLYHVRFGNYPDQSRAVRAGEEVSATLGLKFQIVPPPEPTH